jgi:hypothetical protein
METSSDLLQMSVSRRAKAKNKLNLREMRWIGGSKPAVHDSVAVIAVANVTGCGQL